MTDARARLRAAARAARAGCAAAGAGEALARHALPLVPPGAAVAGTWPIGTEIDMRPLLHALHARGHSLLLPVTPEPGRPLAFRRWAPGVSLVAGRFGTMHPDGPDATPDALLVPLLAFDARCNRLGYGGGYYDRTIAAHPTLPRIGCAYAAQQVDAVPVLPHDAPLHAIATERGVVVAPES